MASVPPPCQTQALKKREDERERDIDDMEDEDDEDDIEHARTLAAIHTTFDFYDADSSGSIDSSEFEKLVAELNGVVEMERESCLAEMEGKDGKQRVRHRLSRFPATWPTTVFMKLSP